MGANKGKYSKMTFRPFTPKRFSLSSDTVVKMVEGRASHSGEYVYHRPSNETPQLLVMNYQFIPVDASLSGDFSISGTIPKLYGHIDHFRDKPKNFKAGNSANAEKGSKFEVAGITYNAKKVNINSRGLVLVELVQDSKCTKVRPEFDLEVAEFLKTLC